MLDDSSIDGDEENVDPCGVQIAPASGVGSPSSASVLPERPGGGSRREMPFRDITDALTYTGALSETTTSAVNLSTGSIRSTSTNDSSMANMEWGDVSTDESSSRSCSDPVASILNGGREDDAIHCANKIFQPVQHLMEVN